MTPEEAAKCCGPVDALLDPEFFKALSDPTRLQLFSCLAKSGRACSVTELTECCSVDFSVVSRHLGILERAGLLAVTKEGRTVLYRVRYQPVAASLRALAKAIEACRPKRKATRPRDTK
jgi:DNA-binding transcriptional ArsR family regulator